MLIGFAVGFAINELLKPKVGDQAYVTPLTGVLPTCNPFGFWLHVFVKSAPASAIGLAIFTVTRTLSTATHPLAVFVTVTWYVVVIAGLARGFEMVVLLNPKEGDHK